MAKSELPQDLYGNHRRGEGTFSEKAAKKIGNGECEKKGSVPW
jgi:hypothetical protein